MRAPELIAQAGVVPYRVLGGVLEFCLITSTRTGRWGFPKGLIDPGETAEETALKEAHEEAGLSGRLVGPPLGGYAYSKWGRELWVTVFLMEITHVADRWDEAAERRRCLCTAAEARTLLGEPATRELLDRALARLPPAG